jgi:hypothetical protein
MKTSPPNQLDMLSARVTALMMLVETLFVDELAKDDDPKTIRAIANAIVNSVLETEAKTREKVIGGDEYAMLISQELSGLIDRAAQRAIRRKQRPSHP